MIREISSFEFCGFYESIFCSSGQFIDHETDIEETLKEKNIKFSEVNYEYVDIHKYEKDVCKKFLEEYVKKIKEILPYKIVCNKNFRFNIIGDDIEIVSPTEYNFRTDRCYCNIQTNGKTLKMIKNYALSLEGAEEYIYERWRSCDGFISFISCNINDWEKTPIRRYEERMLFALLDMILLLDDKENINYIEMTVYEDVPAIEYTIPVVRYDKTDYNCYTDIKTLSDPNAIQIVKYLKGE